MRYILKLDVIGTKDNIRRTDLKRFEADSRENSFAMIWEIVGKRDSALLETREEVEEIKLFEEDRSVQNNVPGLTEIIFQRNIPGSNKNYIAIHICERLFSGSLYEAFESRVVSRFQEEYERNNHKFVGRLHYELVFHYKPLTQHREI